MYQLPIQARPDPTRNPPRHVRTRRYAHLVQESLTSRFAKCVCSIFLSLMLLVGVIFFVLWLSLRPHRPRFYLNSFSLARPGGGSSSSPVAAAAFNVSDRNPNQNVGIYYGDVTGSVYHRDGLVASGHVMDQFYQPSKSTTLMQGQLPAAANATLPSADAGTGRVELRFELQSTIRFKVNMWDSRRHNMHVSCDVVVGGDGNLLPEYVNERCSIYF